MKRTEAESIGDLLRRAIEQSRSGPLLDEIDSVNAWPKVIGLELAAKTMRPMMKKGVMTIRVPSAPLRQELNMMRSMLAQALNAETGKPTVTELKFIG